MTYEELQERIAENNRKMEEMEAMLNGKIDIEMKSKHPDFNSILRMKDQLSSLRNRSIRQTDRLKKEYAMQNSPADVGDVIEAERRVFSSRVGRKVREITHIMQVERIEVAAFEEPQLTFYGIYLKRDGTPLERQLSGPIYEKDITRVVKSK